MEPDKSDAVRDAERKHAAQAQLDAVRRLEKEVSDAQKQVARTLRKLRGVEDDGDADEKEKREREVEASKKLCAKLEKQLRAMKGA
jgi:hypothetical protein